MTESELTRLLFDTDEAIHKLVMEWLESSRIAMLERLVDHDND